MTTSKQLFRSRDPEIIEREMQEAEADYTREQQQVSEEFYRREDSRRLFPDYRIRASRLILDKSGIKVGFVKRHEKLQQAKKRIEALHADDLSRLEILDKELDFAEFERYYPLEQSLIVSMRVWEATREYRNAFSSLGSMLEPRQERESGGFDIAVSRSVNITLPSIGLTEPTAVCFMGPKISYEEMRTRRPLNGCGTEAVHFYLVARLDAVGSSYTPDAQPLIMELGEVFDRTSVEERYRLKQAAEASAWQSA